MRGETMMDEFSGIRTLWGAATDRGAIRAGNEDSYLAQAPLFFVADGMGGHEAGEVASGIAVETLYSLAGESTVYAAQIQGCLEEAAEAIRNIPTEAGRSAGTTVTGVALSEQDGGAYWLVVNLGDSRTYRLADGKLEQISVDHSEVQELVESGAITIDQAATHPRRHVVTKALGAGLDIVPDYWLIPASSRDRLLVCSDGLTGELDDFRISEILLGQSDPQVAAEQLVAEAVEAGGRDNVTVIVVDAAHVEGEIDEEDTSPREGEHADTVPRTSSPEREG